jgi:hypothetical protein
MAVVTHDEVLSKKPRKKRRKGMAALKKLRQAMARRKLEMMREEEQLKEQLYDVFADDDASSTG